jgi:uncharacterized protein YecE (DUF72 family)
MARCYVGTAGWSYEDWEGIVYPPGRDARLHPLAYLARFIDIVEVNSTFYRTPAFGMALSWVKKIEAFPDFLLAVKLHQAFTHVRENIGVKEADDFKRGLAPIVAAGRLAALLVQFPWSFANTPAHRDYLAALFKTFAEYPLALEVRHGTWDAPEAYAFLRERNVAFCNIDQPVIGKSIGPTAVATRKDFAYVRLHGRNAANWFREGAGRDARYDYLYAKDELREWIDRIREIGKDSDRIYVITNNHYRGQAMANALQIKNMITGEKLAVPNGLLKQYPILEDLVDKIRRGQLDLFKDPDGPFPKKD